MLCLGENRLLQEAHSGAPSLAGRRDQETPPDKVTSKLRPKVESGRGEGKGEVFLQLEEQA